MVMVLDLTIVAQVMAILVRCGISSSFYDGHPS
ncbi:hypothetical protein L195_g062794, partial [Trifolium pratense]